MSEKATNPITVIKPSVKIIDPGTDLVQKVADMARICYRSETASGPEADDRLVRGCIKRGHTSVIEHSYVSIFFPGQHAVDTKQFGMDIPENAKVSTRDIWNSFECPAKSEYIKTIWDDRIYIEIESSAAQPRAYQTAVGNFRAWLNVIDDCLAASIQRGVPLYVAFMVATAIELNRKFPTVFGQLIDKINEAFKACAKDHYLREWFLPKATNPEEEAARDAMVLSTVHFEKYVEEFGIVSAAATPKYSLSAVWRTSRAVTHELVRHRVCSFSHESQRWVNYMGRGFEVIAPHMDPVRFAKAVFSECELRGTEMVQTGALISLSNSGFVPENTEWYQKWYRSQVRAAEDYMDLSTIGYYDDDPEHPGEKKYHPVPAEYNRDALTNAFATTIGVTWTPAGFANFMRWRLDDPAWWPIRRLAGAMLISGLKLRHPFFDNFGPNVIKKWVDECVRMGIIEMCDTVTQLKAYQDKRIKAAEENEALVRKQMEEMRRAQAAAAEAEKKAEQPPEAEAPKA